MISDIFNGVGSAMNSVQTRADAKGNAKTIKSVAKLESQKILEQGKKNASSARAAAAENGLDVDVGTAINIQDEIIGDASYNSTINILNANSQAKQVKRTGSMQSNNYGMQSASSFVSAGTKAMGWK
nr:hypothetical protein [Acinetobacter sp. WCHAc060025]